jgi:hypothetical protein
VHPVEAIGISGGLGALALWAIVYTVVALFTRPARIGAGPGRGELRAEPPAVVNLLVNGWTLNGDAAEATLLDLAARGHLEVRQPDSDPMQTTIHLPAREPEGDRLRPYEKQVLDRVRALVTGGGVPANALAFSDEKQAKAWTNSFHAAVIIEARGAGLSRQRLSPGAVSALTVATIVAVIGVAVAMMTWQAAHDRANGMLTLLTGFVTFVVLTVLSGRLTGERETHVGLMAAAHWLSVREWMRGHAQLAELPPASLALGDRSLGYGSALGVTPLASTVLDLGTANRSLVWSSSGGHWRRIHVHYPKFWSHYGRSPRTALQYAGLQVLAGGWLFFLAGLDTFFGRMLLLIEVPLTLQAGYKAVRTLMDQTEPRLTGVVLRTDVWRRRTGVGHKPWLHYLVIDDGISSETTAWGLPSEWVSRCRPGDVVSIEARRWTRRVTHLEVVAQGAGPAGQPTSARSGG